MKQGKVYGAKNGRGDIAWLVVDVIEANDNFVRVKLLPVHTRIGCVYPKSMAKYTLTREQLEDWFEIKNNEEELPQLPITPPQQ